MVVKLTRANRCKQCLAAQEALVNVGYNYYFPVFCQAEKVMRKDRSFLAELPTSLTGDELATGETEWCRRGVRRKTELGPSELQKVARDRGDDLFMRFKESSRRI